MKKIRVFSMTSQWILTLALVAGCGAPGGSSGQRRDAAASVAVIHTNEDGTPPSVVTKEQAVAVARREVQKKGWQDFKVTTCDLQGDMWVVALERLPAVFGGHATIEIPTNGDVTRYVPGR